jgi:hypothetical protein
MRRIDAVFDREGAINDARRKALAAKLARTVLVKAAVDYVQSGVTGGGPLFVRVIGRTADLVFVIVETVP